MWLFALLSIIVSIIGLLWFLFLGEWQLAIVYIGMMIIPLPNWLLMLGYGIGCFLPARIGYGLRWLIQALPLYLFLGALYECCFVYLEPWVRYPAILLMGVYVMNIATGIYQRAKEAGFKYGMSAGDYTETLSTPERCSVYSATFLFVVSGIATAIGLIVCIVLHCM